MQSVTFVPAFIRVTEPNEVCGKVVLVTDFNPCWDAVSAFDDVAPGRKESRQWVQLLPEAIGQMRKV